MASTSLYIPDMRQAIEEKRVPGAFYKNRMVFRFPTLSYIGQNGKKFLWTIDVRLIRFSSSEKGPGRYIPISNEYLDGNPLDGLIVAEISVESKQEGGKIRDASPTYVTSGKNLGKKNATNVLTQGIRNALGLYNKQRKKVTTNTCLVKCIPTHSPSTDPMPPPMLLKDLDSSTDSRLTPQDFISGVTVQRKLNGVHFVAFLNSCGKAVGYSRTGKVYPEQEHLVAELEILFHNLPRLRPGSYALPYSGDSEKDLNILEAYEAVSTNKRNPPRVYLAGELYLHGKSLNWISGQARKSGDTPSLEFHIFDLFFPRAKAAGHDMLSRDRQNYLSAIFQNMERNGIKLPHLKRVENFSVCNADEIKILMKDFVDGGYEGAVVRRDNGIYRYSYNNYHSGEVLKIKPIFTDEFPVIAFTQGRGKDLGAVIWICEVNYPVNPNDKTFTVMPKDLSYPERKALFQCLQEEISINGRKISRFDKDIKGLPLTIEYRELSPKTGKPLQAKALAFRTYERGADNDPVKRLFDECVAPKLVNAKS